jgi:hypothetical protein
LRKIKLIFFIFFYVGISSAQNTYLDTVQLVTGSFILKDCFKKIRPDIGLDARSSSIEGSKVRVAGLKLGVEYRRIHRFGIGLYGLSNAIEKNNVVLDVPSRKVNYLFSYQSLYYDRVLFFNPKWEVSSALHLGGGKVETSYLPLLGNSFQPYNVQEVSVMEITANVQYNFFYWLSIGVGGGGRVIFRGPKQIRKAYSAPVTLFTINIRVVKLITSIFNKNVKNEY